LRVNKRRLVILVFGAFLLAIIVGELAVFFFMGSRGHTNLTGAAGLECGEWSPVSLNRSLIPGYPQIYMTYSLSKVSDLGDFVLKVIFQNNGKAPFNLDTLMGQNQNGMGDMVVVVFDKYGFIDQKPLVVREESRIVNPGSSSVVVFKLHFSITDPVYSMLVIPHSGVRLGSWMKDFDELEGVCDSKAQNLGGAMFVERWVTLVEGLTVFESFLDSNGKQVSVNITGEDGLVYRASVYDDRGVLVQVLESPRYAKKIFRFNGLMVLGVSAGQIRGEPYTIDVFNSLNINGVDVQGFRQAYSAKAWPDKVPGKWVAGQYKIDLDNGLKLTIEFAYNGYILVVREGDLYNPTKNNITFNSLITCSPTTEYPIPAIKFSSGSYYPSWLVLNVTSKIVKPETINGSLALKITVGPGHHVKSRGWAIIEAPYKKGENIPVSVTLPWCKKVTVDLSQFYK
jgi:hypothetical protein